MEQVFQKHEQSILDGLNDIGRVIDKKEAFCCEHVTLHNGHFRHRLFDRTLLDLSDESILAKFEAIKIPAANCTQLMSELYPHLSESFFQEYCSRLAKVSGSEVFMTEVYRINMIYSDKLIAIFGFEDRVNDFRASMLAMGTEIGEPVDFKKESEGKFTTFDVLALDTFNEAAAAGFKTVHGIQLDFTRDDGASDRFNFVVVPAIPDASVLEAWSTPSGEDQEKEKGIVDLYTFADAFCKDIDVISPAGLAHIIQAFGETNKQGFEVGVNSNGYYLYDKHIGILFWLSSKSDITVEGNLVSAEEIKIH